MRTKRVFAKISYGGVVVEAAVGSVVFFTLILLTCQTIILFYRAATAQYIVSREARISSSVQGMTNCAPLACPISANTIRQRIMDRAADLNVDTSNWQISIDAVSCIIENGAQQCTTTPNSLGNNRDLLFVRVNPGLSFEFLNISRRIDFAVSAVITREAI